VAEPSSPFKGETYDVLTELTESYGLAKAQVLRDALLLVRCCEAASSSGIGLLLGDRIGSEVGGRPSADLAPPAWPD
jgi:hypothetical protein